MGTARQFNKVLHNEANIHAAWLPITNTFELGDYGLIDDGVFSRLGNIREFGIDSFDTANGPTSRIDFKSDGATVVKLDGGVEVDVIPEGAVEGKIRVHFSNANSFLIKADIRSKEMSSINQVGRSLRAAPGWKRRYKVLSALYVAENATVITTRDAGAEIELSGDAQALEAFNVGSASAGVSVSKSNKVGLEFVGRSGVIGLGMFKLRLFGGIGVEAVPGGEAPPEDVTEQVGDGADLADDI